MNGAGCLFVLGVVVFAAGWLAKDHHERHLVDTVKQHPAQRPPSVRVMREPRDWNREGWL